MMTFLKNKVKAFVNWRINLWLSSVLFLLFFDQAKKEAVNWKGKGKKAADVKSGGKPEPELYSLERIEDASLNKFKEDGRITEEQAKAYKEYNDKNGKGQSLKSMIKAFTMESLLVLGLVVSCLGLVRLCSSPLLRR